MAPEDAVYRIDLGNAGRIQKGRLDKRRAGRTSRTHQGGEGLLFSPFLLLAGSLIKLRRRLAGRVTVHRRGAENAEKTLPKEDHASESI